jgi:hypothetical protein
MSNKINTFILKAENSLGAKRQNATLAVKERGGPPTFIRKLEDRLVNEYERIVMEAQLDTKIKPKATVQWFRDGQPLTSTDKMRLDYDESSGVIRVIIPSADLNDKCRITVKAENTFGASETSASIAVQKKITQTKPQFMSELGPITVSEGDSLLAKVLISGTPEPTAKWYIGNQLVAQTEDTEIKNHDGVYSLVIHGCTTDMTGTIKCKQKLLNLSL